MKIDIIDDNGSTIELVRFFRVNGKQFLIFLNDNSMDSEGHVTIHVSSIDNGSNTASMVSDEDWELVKNTIKSIVNANKNNQPLSIEDLDYNTLDRVSVVGDRALKLMSNYVDLLKINQPVFEKVVVNTFDNASVANNDFNQFNFQTPEPINNPVGPMNVSDSFSVNDVQNIQSNNVGFASNSELDYKALYYEQLELVNQLKNEIANYTSKIDAIKNVLN